MLGEIVIMTTTEKFLQIILRYSGQTLDKSSVTGVPVEHVNGMESKQDGDWWGGQLRGEQDQARLGSKAVSIALQKVVVQMDNATNREAYYQRPPLSPIQEIPFHVRRGEVLLLLDQTFSKSILEQNTTNSRDGM